MGIFPRNPIYSIQELKDFVDILTIDKKAKMKNCTKTRLMKWFAETTVKEQDAGDKARRVVLNDPNRLDR